MSRRILVFISFLLFLALVCIAPVVCSASTAYEVASPDGNLTIALELKTNPQPYLPGSRAYYHVSYKGKPILIDSPLGLDFFKGKALDQDFEVVNTSREAHDSVWQNHFGSKLEVRDHFNQLTVSLRERQSPNRHLDLIFRAYDEGVAFRYFLPQQEALKQFVLSAENTGFYLAENATTYALNIRSYVSPYEADYPETPLDQIKPTSVVPLPLLIHLHEGPWAALLEADLTDYAGMYVGGVQGIPNALMSKLSPLPDHSDEAVIASSPKATPWRVLLLNPRPGGLIESKSLILNLNPPCTFDTSWIHPGKVTFPWWSGFLGGNGEFNHDVNTGMYKHYIDFAGKNGIPYIEVSDYWYVFKGDWHQGVTHTTEDDVTRASPAVDIADVLQYGKQHGVGELLWVEWKALQRQIDTAFPLYEKWGAAGVKVDLMDHDNQEMVNYYAEVARKAAEHHLLVDFHGAYKPTGMQRTYPNVLNEEGVMGMEHDKLGGLLQDVWAGHVTPEHDVTLPFTRMLAGPMDYTPGSFRNATRNQFKVQWLKPMSEGTRAHQLAMYAVYEMPLAMVSDYPEAYEGQPEFEFIEKVPTAWDDTKVLNGEPGKFITIARRNGANWYLGSMTNWDTRELKIPLDFLGQGAYEAKIFADGPDADREATSVSISKKIITSGDQLDLHLAPGGGAAVIFTPVK
jgi:alpha-glucosidase